MGKARTEEETLDSKVEGKPSEPSQRLVAAKECSKLSFLYPRSRTPANVDSKHFLLQKEEAEAKKADEVVEHRSIPGLPQ